MAFQLVVDNQDLTSLKAGFYHIETVLSDLPGPPPGAAQDGLSSPPRVGAVSLSPSASQLNISARDHGRMPALTRRRYPDARAVVLDEKGIKGALGVES
jgi:hypothetical protein